MTLLATIKEHTLHFFCPCGHRGEMDVEDILKTGRRAWRLEDVRVRAKCAKCGKRGLSRVSISYKHPISTYPKTL